jgi:hypothetical protein
VVLTLLFFFYFHKEEDDKAQKQITDLQAQLTETQKENQLLKSGARDQPTKPNHSQKQGLK